MKTLLVFAMKEEAAGLFEDHDTLYTGIGKINASYALARRLNESRPDLIINLGTAGSRKHAGGALINPTKFIQRDMDVRPLGFANYQTPFSDDPIILEYGQTLKGITGGTCGTGDNFDTSEAANDFDVVDMEGYALSLICHREDIPFICLKYVSDGADDNAQNDWNAALSRAATALKTTLRQGAIL